MQKTLIFVVTQYIYYNTSTCTSECKTRRVFIIFNTRVKLTALLLARNLYFVEYMISKIKNRREINNPRFFNERKLAK